MNENKEASILAAIKKAEPEKKRVTFFISVDSKNALAAWCKKNGVSESSAIEELIKSTVPNRFFGGKT